MAQKTLDRPLTRCDIINRLAHLPELLRDRNEGEEAENLDCLIEEMKNDLNKGL
ncbi:MAG: hypothetical protein WC433_07055 [Candidatus Omnitrophota bacterium]|jgi:hypothetical protein